MEEVLLLYLSSRNSSSLLDESPWSLSEAAESNVCDFRNCCLGDSVELPLLGFNVVCVSIGGDDSGNLACDSKASRFLLELRVKLLTMVAVRARESRDYEDLVPAS